MLSHYVSYGITKEAGSSNEIVFTHHMAQGDPFCRYVVRRRSEPWHDLDDLGRAVETLPPIEFPPEEREALTVNIETTVWTIWTKALSELMGSDRTVDLMREPSETLGREFGARLKKEWNFAVEEARQVEKGIEVLGAAMGQEYEPLFENSQEVKVEVRHCSLADGPIEACMQFEFLANGICQSIGPEYELKHQSMHTRGDERCVWAVRRKAGIDAPASKGMPDQEDPAKLLALRYAKGEISEEELDRRMAYLRKHGLVK
jgi:hypothetical protein